MSAFQCSRHATPAGIAGVFKHCAKFQKGQDLDTFVSVVVLDEVGLAEDSENMPLKVGCDEVISSLESEMITIFIDCTYISFYVDFSNHLYFVNQIL